MPICEGNTLCQVTFGDVGKDLWSIGLSDVINFYEELYQTSSEEDLIF